MSAESKSSGSSASSSSSAAAAAASVSSLLPSDLPVKLFFPPATEFKNSKRKGRHVTADRPFVPGELFFSSPAFAGVVNDEYIDKFCHRCFETAAALYKCSSCDFARFCSTSCMNQSANIHNMECGVLRRLKSIGMEGESAPVRVVVKLMCLNHHENQLKSKNLLRTAGKTDKSSKSAAGNTKLLETQKPGNCFEDANNLISHEEKFDSQHKLTIKLILSRLAPLFPDPAIWLGDDAATRLFLQIHCNAHHVTNQNKLRIGLGLFIPAAYLNHSCIPTCVYSYDNTGAMNMRCIRPMAVGDEFSYSYIDIYQSRAARHQKLKELYFIDSCFCQRCNDAKYNDFDRLIDAVVCAKCNEGIFEKKKKSKPAAADSEQLPAAIVALAPGIPFCPKCYEIVTADELKQYQSTCEGLFDQGRLLFESGEYEESIRFFEKKVLNSLGKFRLHQRHSIAFNSYTMLISLNNLLKQWMKSREYSMKLIECMELCQLMNHPELSDAYFVKGEAEINLIHQYENENEENNEKSNDNNNSNNSNSIDYHNESVNSFTKCVEIRDICYGKKHPQTKAAIMAKQNAEELKAKEGKKKKK